MNAHVNSSTLNECLPALNRFALSLTKNQDRAADLVQDSVERALRKAHLFDGKNMRAWLFTICKRVFLNDIRRQKTRGRSIDFTEATHDKLALKQSQDLQMHCRDLEHAFARLPKRDQTILSLIAIEGLKYEETASELGIPVGTVRSRLSRARQRLRDSLDTPELNEGRDRTRIADNEKRLTAKTS